MTRKKIDRWIIYYLLLCTSALLVSFISIRIWNAHLTNPLTFEGDGIGWSVLTKNIIDGGSMSNLVNLGAPFEQNPWTYRPEFSLINALMIHFLKLFTSKFGVILNIIFFLSIILVAITSNICFRIVGISPQISFLLSLLYTNLPYHYYRGTMHINLAMYCLVPVVCCMVYKLLIEDMGDDKEQPKTKNMKYFFCFVLFFILGISDLYYMFLSMLVLGLGVVVRIIKGKKISSFYFLVPAILGAILGIAICFIMWWSSIGKITGISRFDTRSIYDLEVYGLKLSSLVLPIKNHIVSFLANISNQYHGTTPFNEEGSYAALGLVGTIGFLCSLCYLFVDSKEDNKRIKVCGYINILIVIVAINGGLGSLIGLFITSSIRCYNRLSVYIAFFSFCCLGLICDKFVLKKIKTRKMWQSIICILLFIGLFDQMSTETFSKTDEKAFKFDEAASIASYLNQDMKEGGNVFLYPFQRTTNYNPLNGRDRYELYLPYLFTNKNIKWAFYYGQSTHDDWAEAISDAPIEILCQELTKYGFKAIVIDTYFINDSEVTSVIDEFENVLGEIKQQSTNGRYLYFQIKDTDNYSPIVSYSFEEGFYGKEKDKNRIWSWSDCEGTLLMSNYEDDNIGVNFEFYIYCLLDNKEFPLDIYMNDDLVFSGKLNAENQFINLELLLKPGQNKLEIITSQDCYTYLENDSRKLSFCINKPAFVTE